MSWVIFVFYAYESLKKRWTDDRCQNQRLQWQKQPKPCVHLPAFCGNIWPTPVTASLHLFIVILHREKSSSRVTKITVFKPARKKDGSALPSIAAFAILALSEVKYPFLEWITEIVALFWVLLGELPIFYYRKDNVGLSYGHVFPVKY